MSAESDGQYSPEEYREMADTVREKGLNYLADYLEKGAEQQEARRDE